MENVENSQLSEESQENRKTPLRDVAYFTLIASIILFIAYALGTSQYCFSKSISEIVLWPYILLVLVSLFAFVKLRQGAKWIVILFLIIFLSVIGTISLSGPTPKGKDAYIRSDIDAIAKGQRLYFEDYNHYAESLSDLTDNYILKQEIENSFSGEQYTFSSDGDSWSVQADLYSNDYQLCGRFGAKEYSYRCSASSGQEAVCEDVEK